MPDQIWTGEGWELRNGDSCEELPTLAHDSIDLSVYSVPFQNLYTYSASERDLGNSRTQEEFLEHFRYLSRALFAATKPGRLTCCHVSQVAAQKAKDGFIGLFDLRGEMIRAYVADDWIYHGEICIDRDPQAQAVRTHAKGLLFVQLRKDSSWLRPALADYVLVFRKPGENAVPIAPDLTNEDWIAWARPVWYNVRETDTLNTAVAKENDDERHICPMSLDTVERCIRLWSNPNDLVCDPFSGIGSTGYEAIRLGRRFVGFELKRSYAETAAKNLKIAESLLNQGSLFASSTPEPQS